MASAVRLCRAANVLLGGNHDEPLFACFPAAAGVIPPAIANKLASPTDSHVGQPRAQSPRRRYRQYSTCLSFSPALDAWGKNRQHPEQSPTGFALSVPPAPRASAGAALPWAPMSNRARHRPLIPVPRAGSTAQILSNGQLSPSASSDLASNIISGWSRWARNAPTEGAAAEHSTVIPTIQMTSLTHGSAGRRGREQQHHHHPGP